MLLIHFISLWKFIIWNINIGESLISKLLQEYTQSVDQTISYRPLKFGQHVHYCLLKILGLENTKGGEITHECCLVREVQKGRG